MQLDSTSNLSGPTLTRAEAPAPPAAPQPAARMAISSSAGCSPMTGSRLSPSVGPSGSGNRPSAAFV